jgi:hypothetical protein
LSISGMVELVLHDVRRLSLLAASAGANSA